MALREAGIKTETDHTGRSMKAQFKYADKIKAPYVVIIGGDELEKGVVMFRDMKTGQQEEIDLDKIKEHLIAAIKNEV